jgi:TonB family protein
LSFRSWHAGDTLERSVTRGTTTSTERCEREAQVPVPTTCTTPHVAPHTIQAGPVPYPAEAYQQHLSGTVAVAVTLDDRSQILWAAVQSSPSPLLNDSALSAAENTVFQVQISKCRPIAGDYIFTVEFTRR